MVLGIPVAYGLSRLIENRFHRYVLHDLGKDRTSFWSFHFHDHHNAATRNGMLDPDYLEPWFFNGPRTKEVLSLAAGATAALTVTPAFPFFGVTSLALIWNYYSKHKRSHTDPEYAARHMVNHLIHHMKNPNGNWEVTGDISDRILGTCLKIGERELEELKRKTLEKYRARKDEVYAEIDQRKRRREDYFASKMGGLVNVLEGLLPS